MVSNNDTSKFGQKKFLTLCVAAAVGAPAAPVLGAELEEIVVTARKREESIMKVPVVASVLSGEQMEQYSQGNLADFADRVPGLTLGEGTLSFGTQVSLRGIGTSTLNTTLDQSVALNVDGVQMTQGLAYSAAMFDMQQLEVLKGPQALFYGKAAPGGVISVQTADPGNEFEAILRHGYEFNAEEHRTDFILSGPVTDTLGLRLATRYMDSNGWMTNEAVAAPGTGARTPQDRDFAPKEEWLVRGTAVWEPTERFSSKLKINLHHLDRENDGGQTQMFSCPDGVGAVPGFGIPFLGGSEDCDYDDELQVVWFDPEVWPLLRNNGVPFMEVDQKFGSLEMNYDLTPDLTLTSVTGYYDLDQSSMINSTNSTFAAPAIGVDPDFTREDFTQEVRLTSNYADSALNYMVGAFYQDGEMVYENKLLGNQVYGLPTYLNKGYQTIDIETKSVFGQLIWNLTPELEVAGGVRWTDEERHYEAYAEALASNTLTPPTFVPVAQPDMAEDDFSPELTVTWTPRDTLTVFGSLKRAFKSGSYDTVSVPAPGGDVSFGEEQITGGDIGFKARLMDRRLRLNAATYYYDYEDMQVGANVNTPEGEIVIRTLNAASSEIYGAEFDLNYNPAAVEGLTLSAAANYNIAEFKEFENAQCWGGQLQSEGCQPIFNEAGERVGEAQDLSGEKQVRAPEWTAFLSADYVMPVGDEMDLQLGWYTSYSSEYLTNLLNRDDMWQDAYFTHNASIALSGPGEAWKLSLIGNNITDELVAGNCVNANYANGAVLGGTNTGGTTRGPAGVEELTCDVTSRRAVWLRFEMKLGELL